MATADLTSASSRLPQWASRLAIRVSSVLACFFLWSGAAWIVAQCFRRPDVILPYPWDVVAAFPRLSVFLGPGTEQTTWNALIALLTNSLDSALRLLLGLLIGGIVGIGTGLLFGLSRHVRHLFRLPLLMLRTIPLFALIPLFLAWFGGSELGIVVYIAFGVFSMLLINTLSAIEHVPPVIQNLARTLGASRLHVYRTVVIPAITPEIVGGIRVVVGIAWALLIGGELLGAQSGVGRILSLSEQYSDTSRMIIIVFSIVTYAILIDYLVRFISFRITSWSPGAMHLEKPEIHLRNRP